MSYSPIHAIVKSLILMSLFSSCEKSKLTNISDSGANTFSCLMNGKIFTSCGGGLFSDPHLTAYLTPLSAGSQSVDVKATCNDEYPYETMYLGIDHFRGEGQYLLKDSNNYLIFYQRYLDLRNPGASDLKYAAENGKITIIKADRSRFIVSGTFEGILVNTRDASDKITVKLGRFDIKYR